MKNEVEAVRWYSTVDKTAWPPGPWQTEPDKVQWVDRETALDCLAVRQRRLGHWCGYVGVPPGHPFYGIVYDACPVAGCAELWCEHRPETLLEIHGGITYSGACQEGDEATSICHVPLDGRPDEVWWFGFDCAHSGDLCPSYYNQIAPVSSGKEMYRTLMYVQAECATLAAQLASIAVAP